MIEDLNELKESITRWGLPDSLKHKKNEIIFMFDDKGLSVTKVSGYEVKFYLYDKESENVIFRMGFMKSSLKMREIMKCNRLTLDLLYVNAAYRNKRIAIYYINKLIKFAIQENFNHVFVIPDADAKIFKGDSKKDALSQEQLREFYMKNSTEKMRIVFPKVTQQ